MNERAHEDTVTKAKVLSGREVILSHPLPGSCFKGGSVIPTGVANNEETPRGVKRRGPKFHL